MWLIESKNDNEAQQKGRDHRRAAAENAPAMRGGQAPPRDLHAKASAVRGPWQGTGGSVAVGCESRAPLRVACLRHL